MKAIIENTVRLHLFIRKFKEVEGIRQPCLYFGQVTPQIETVQESEKEIIEKAKTKTVKIVSMCFTIPEVPENIYNEFITDTDTTKVD